MANQKLSLWDRTALFVYGHLLIPAAILGVISFALLIFGLLLESLLSQAIGLSGDPAIVVANIAVVPILGAIIVLVAVFYAKAYNRATQLGGEAWG